MLEVGIIMFEVTLRTQVLQAAQWGTLDYYEKCQRNINSFIMQSWYSDRGSSLRNVNLRMLSYLAGSSEILFATFIRSGKIKNVKK